MTTIEPRTFLLLLVLAVSSTVVAEPGDFESWLAELRIEAAARGISPSIIEQTLIDLVNVISEVWVSKTSQILFTKANHSAVF